MYTAVLMMAMTASADLPDLGRRGGGCCGCYGGRRGGRRGGCCGCYGGYGYGGGYGGCMGMGMGYGGCMGMGMGYGGCMGMGMGYGGCMGMGMGYGGCMGMGMGYGGCMGMGMGYGGCMGCLGGGLGVGLGGGIIMQGASSGTNGEQLNTKPKSKNNETMVPAPATIVVDLPADAKLFIGNDATTSTGKSRVFTSPVLKPGKAYQYTLKAKIVRDGKAITAEKVIAVKAGETTPVTLTLPAVGVAQR